VDNHYKKVGDVMADKAENKKALDPRLVAEWHPTLNGDLKPSDVTYGSSKIRWWLCVKGHEYQMAVKDRSRGHGCPYCTGRKAGADNNLEVLYPDLAKEWHPKLNGDLKPSGVTPYSHEKVWWTCERGHGWEAVVKNRAYGAGCPVCSGRVASDDNNLEVLYPDLAKEWHPTRNKDLKPSDVTPHSHKKVWWTCRSGHTWPAIVKNRAYGAGCPVCSGRVASDENNLEVLYPDLAKEWHPTRNKDLKPSDVLTDEGNAQFKHRTVVGENRLVAVAETEKSSDEGNEGTKDDHTKIQWLLLRLGSEMGCRVSVAINDRGRQWQGNRFRDLPGFQEKPIQGFPPPTKSIIEYIDVLWLDEYQIVAAFEIEITTGISPGLNRMSDLIAAHPSLLIPVYIVAPDESRDKVVAQINRPAFASLRKPLSGVCRYIAFSRLKEFFERNKAILKLLKADSTLAEISESCEREQ
jgi:hypothetical protein